MIAVHQTNALGLRPALDDLGGALKLQILNQRHGISVHKNRSMRVLHEPRACGNLRLLLLPRPLMPAGLTLPQRGMLQ